MSILFPEKLIQLGELSELCVSGCYLSTLSSLLRIVWAGVEYSPSHLSLSGKGEPVKLMGCFFSISCVSISDAASGYFIRMVLNL